jgi:hypothetical protein
MARRLRSYLKSPHPRPFSRKQGKGEAAFQAPLRLRGRDLWRGLTNGP